MSSYRVRAPRPTCRVAVGLLLAGACAGASAQGPGDRPDLTALERLPEWRAPRVNVFWLLEEDRADEG